MKTFVEALDFHGRAVVPFTTHAMSGLAPSNVPGPGSSPGQAQNIRS
ncbi:hypothetical protein [Streptomyces sp. NPDC090298]